jgi:protoheme IX farnesyltransferase
VSHLDWLAVRSRVGTLDLAALALTTAGSAYAGSLVVGAPSFLLAYRSFHRVGGEPQAVRAFFTSNAFLAVAFVAWGVDGVVTGHALLTGTVAAVATAAAFVGLWTARPSLRNVRAAPPPLWVSRAARACDRLRVRVTG